MSAPAKTAPEGVQHVVGCNCYDQGTAYFTDPRCHIPNPTSPARAVAEAIGAAFGELGDGLVAAATEAQDLKLENERLRIALQNLFDACDPEEHTADGQPCGEAGCVFCAARAALAVEQQDRAMARLRAKASAPVTAMPEQATVTVRREPVPQAAGERRKPEMAAGAEAPTDPPQCKHCSHGIHEGRCVVADGDGVQCRCIRSGGSLEMATAEPEGAGASRV